MSHPASSGSGNARRRPSTPDSSDPDLPYSGKECPWCGSWDTEFVQRGFAGGQRSKDQYIRCHDCEKVTYEIIATTDRDIRINNHRTGGTYRDADHRAHYTIYRTLKVGFNEFLLYLRPKVPGSSESK